jgi:hypothetical protein
MELKIIFAHASLSILLFFLLNWIGRHSIKAGYIQMSILAKADEAPAYNFLYRAFSPVAFITVSSSLLYKAGLDWIVEDIYLVVIYYFAFRLTFNIATGRALLLNWVTQILYVIVSVPVSYYVYENLILHKEFLFPDTKEIGSAVWLAIIVYVYHTCNNVKLSTQRTKARKENYLQVRYQSYYSLYGKIIEEIAESKCQECLIYAVLIHEAFNRPKIYRLIENALFYLGLAKTLGIMQVTTKTFINDEESVRLGAKKIVNDHLQAKLKVESSKYPGGSWAIRRKVLESYNPDSEYINEVTRLYDQIVDLFYPEERTDWEAEIETLQGGMLNCTKTDDTEPINSSQHDANGAGASA